MGVWTTWQFCWVQCISLIGVASVDRGAQPVDASSKDEQIVSKDPWLGEDAGINR